MEHQRSFYRGKFGKRPLAFELESKKEVDRVLMFRRRRFRAHLVHLRT